MLDSKKENRPNSLCILKYFVDGKNLSTQQLQYEIDTKLKLEKESIKKKIILIGPCGYGKSTTGNMIIRNLCQTNN